MAKLTTSGVVRDLLTINPNMSADDVIRRAKARGIKSPEKSIRTTVYNIKNEFKRKAAAAPMIARSAAHETTPPKTAPVASAPAVSVAATGTPALGGVLANVALVNKLVKLCGGVENLRQAADAVQACGSTEAFLQHLELVASIRKAETK